MRKTREALGHSEPDIFVETINFQDVPTSALAHVVAGAELEHRRLPGGGFKIGLLQCHLPNSVVSQGIYEPAVLVSGMFSKDAVTLGTMLFQNETTIVNGSKIRAGTIQFFSEKSDLCYRAWPEASWFTLVIPRNKLLEFCAEYLEEIPELPCHGLTTIEPAARQSKDRFFDNLRDLSHSLRNLGTVQNAARLGELIENDVLTGIADFLGTKPHVCKRSDRRRLRMCCEVLHDATVLVKSDPNKKLDLQTLSKATGLSIRTLQRAFQSEFGLCSQEWLRIERLHRVREDLLDGICGTSVMKTATRWGFLHLGRFSHYYRDLFGESPSMTVARRSVITSRK